VQGEASRKRELDLHASLDRKLQILLGFKYQEMMGNFARPLLNDIEFRTFSQNAKTAYCCISFP
jgi:hypothetical protein